jgi:NAD dependent epimerase/dehydratase family enzyme
VVLEGQRVLPTRLQEQGFQFQFPDLSAALAAATSPVPH